MMPSDKLRLVNSTIWWHSIDVGDGIVTPGYVTPDTHATIAAHIPADLSGKRVLDVGCSDGYYSFLAADRGATIVSAIDPRHCDDATRIALQLLPRDNILYDRLDLFDQRLQPHDICLFLGVLYHLKNPLHGLEVLASLTTELAFIESHFITEDNGYPVARFYPGSELNHDPTNWWGPNIRCLLDMCRAAGFTKAEAVCTYGVGAEYGRVIVHAIK